MSKYSFSGEYSCSRCHDDSSTDRFCRCKQCNKELGLDDAIVGSHE